MSEWILCTSNMFLWISFNFSALHRIFCLSCGLFKVLYWSRKQNEDCDPCVRNLKCKWIFHISITVHIDMFSDMMRNQILYTCIPLYYWSCLRVFFDDAYLPWLAPRLPRCSKAAAAEMKTRSGIASCQIYVAQDWFSKDTIGYPQHLQDLTKPQ